MPIERRILHRAWIARSLGWSSFLAMAVLGLTMATYLFSSTLAGLTRGNFPSSTELAEIAQDIAKNDVESEELAKLKAEVQIKRFELESATLTEGKYMSAIFHGASRLGALLITLQTLYALFTIMQYQFRLADHLQNCLAALELSNGNAETFAKLSAGFAASSPRLKPEEVLSLEKIVEATKAGEEKPGPSENKSVSKEG